MDKKRLKPISLRRMTQPLRNNWIIFLFSFLSVVVTVGFLTIISEHKYEASATIFIREGGELEGQLFDVPAVFFQKYLIKNQVAILESRNLAAEVIRRFQNSSYRDSLSILGNRSHKKASNFLGKISFWKIKNDSIQHKPSFQEMMNRFQASTKVVYGRETNIIELKGTASSPMEAALIVNTWVDAYQDLDLSSSHRDVVETKRFLEAKLNDINQKLSTSEENLAKYQKEKKVVSMSQETSQLVTQLSGFESLYNQTRTDLEALENQLQYLKNQLDDSKKHLVEDMVRLSTPVLEELQKQMAQLVTEKAAYEAQLIGAGYSLSNDVKLTQMENRLNGVKEKIIEETNKFVQKDLTQINPLDHSQNLIKQILELETNQKSLSSKERTLKSIVDEYSGKLNDLPETNLKLAQLERDVQVNREIYVMLREKYEETRIREAGQVGIIRVVDRAEPPSVPVSPRTKMNLILGCFFGILLGIGLSFGREYLENAVKTAEDLEEMGLHVIGSIPSIKKKVSHRKEMKDWNIHRAKEIFPYILNHHNNYPNLVEAYRLVRTSILFHLKQMNAKTVLFTSPGPYEGKSTTVANASIAMARKGIKTLLVDSDLRKPVLDVLFTGSHKRIGLTNYLSKTISWNEGIRETKEKGLYFYAAGSYSKNAPELITLNSMKRFIREAKNEFGAILFDSPPILPVTDAMALASIVDSVILVVRADRTSREATYRAIELLKDVGVTFLGVIVTGVDNSELYGYGSYYHSYGNYNKKIKGY
jgi:capsular exopolysaccharide synthesis family protein